MLSLVLTDLLYSFKLSPLCRSDTAKVKYDEIVGIPDQAKWLKICDKAKSANSCLDVVKALHGVWEEAEGDSEEDDVRRSEDEGFSTNSEGSKIEK